MLEKPTQGHFLHELGLHHLTHTYRGMKSVIHNNSAPPVPARLPLGCEVEGWKMTKG